MILEDPEISWPSNCPKKIAIPSSMPHLPHDLRGKGGQLTAARLTEGGHHGGLLQNPSGPLVADGVSSEVFPQKSGFCLEVAMYLFFVLRVGIFCGILRVVALAPEFGGGLKGWRSNRWSIFTINMSGERCKSPCLGKFRTLQTSSNLSQRFYFDPPWLNKTPFMNVSSELNLRW